jgi:drug/metabolite transporter (DMT)-like permease
MSIPLIAGEGLLSLYPVLIKSVPLDLTSHTLVRLITTTIACFPFTSVPISTFISQLSYHIVSILYVAHIYSSYLGFKNLEVGVALTLFYTYPIINVLIAGSFTYSLIVPFLASFLGVILISNTATQTDTAIQTQTTSGSKSLGIISIFIAAVTESLIYSIYKFDTYNSSNPFDMLFGMCLTGSILLSIYYVYKSNLNKTEHKSPNYTGILKLVIINAIIGVGGYLLRFSSLFSLSTEWFSILSFSGIVFGYLYGWSFYGERLNWSKVIGTLLIIYGAYHVHSLGV